MARAKKRKTGNGPKSSSQRARKVGGRAPAASATKTPKKLVRSKTTDSKVPNAKSAPVKTLRTLSVSAKAEVAKGPTRRPAAPKGALGAVAIGAAAASDFAGKAKTGGEIGRTTKRRQETPPSTGTPASNKPPRAVDPPATKWTGNVIRVPALPKGGSVKSNRTKPSARSNGRNSATEHDPIQFPEENVAVPRTTLTPAQLREFKELLLHKRAELCGDVVRLTDEALHRASDGVNDQSSMPIHMADLGTDNWEQEFTLGLIANEQAVVREIDQALERIAAKTYGVCVATHVPIGLARLRAKPWAKYCIEYARAREEGRAN